VAGIPVSYLWLIAALSIFVSAGFNARGIGAKVGTGVYALYGLTGFFGDILSYSRLFALGLATGVIAQVVNILAGMVGGIPVIGWLVMLILLVFGHIFNLAINALGAFIHTARLQFVEFFTKFFEGGGRRFVPFSRQFRFTTLIDENPQGEMK
jgi:V/A-type H+-transporting ATPase subunit I